MQRLFQRRRQYGVATDEVTGRATPTAPSAPATSARETFPSGIKLLHEPENAIIDIVFVHGLMGDREMTWTAHDTSEPWPKALLPSELPAARVLTFGYDAYVADWRGVVSQNRIANHAWNLLTSLATHRERDESNERPILFVCHSLGGLVCEDALVTARQRSERHIQDILQSTRGIAFLGTPHHGAGLAKWAERLSKSIGIITQTNSEIIEVLQRESEVLARIQDGFHNMVMARNTEGQPIEISCFFEELPLQGIGQVVPQHSAILPGYIPIGIHGNHMDMTKFASKDDPGFVAVCGELRRWIREISRVGRQNLATPSTVDTGRSAIPEDSPTPTTPLLLIAAMLPNSEELERALRMAPDVNIREDHPPGRSALHMAAIFNQPGNISLLLRSGVNRHATTDQGYTPLMAACIAGSTEAVKVLLEEGDQDPNWRDLHQNTPLHAAAVNGHSGVIRELLDHGADPFATTEDGWTPLTVASFTQNAQMTQMLTEAMQAMQANNTTNIS